VKAKAITESVVANVNLMFFMILILKIVIKIIKTVTV
jgi:hypothetical protein